jgi:hypothetical protein
MLRRIVQARFDGGPRRNPQRIYAAGLIQNLRKVAAFGCYGEPDEFVSELDGAAALKAYFRELKRINCLSRILFALLYPCQGSVMPSLIASRRLKSYSRDWKVAEKLAGMPNAYPL